MVPCRQPDHLWTYSRASSATRALSPRCQRSNPRKYELCHRMAHAHAVLGCGELPGGSRRFRRMRHLPRLLDGGRAALPRRVCPVDIAISTTCSIRPAGEGEGRRLPAHAPELFERCACASGPGPMSLVTRGKVPDVLAERARRRASHSCIVDMNNAQAESGALETLFDRITPGGMIVFDDYGWTGYRDAEARSRCVHAASAASPCSNCRRVRGWW